MSTNVPRQTLDQQRAKHAWERSRVPVKNKDEKFALQAKKLPARIVTSGLGAALAFLQAKDEAPALLEALNDWVTIRIPGKNKGLSLLNRIVSGDAIFLRHATGEVLAYLPWLIRFLEAEGLTNESGDSE